MFCNFILAYEATEEVEYVKLLSYFVGVAK